MEPILYYYQPTKMSWYQPRQLYLNSVQCRFAPYNHTTHSPGTIPYYQLVLLHCGENSWIFRDAADQTLPVTEFSDICNWKIKFRYLSRNNQLQVMFGLLHLGKSRSFRHSVYFESQLIAHFSYLEATCLYLIACSLYLAVLSSD